MFSLPEIFMAMRLATPADYGRVRELLLAEDMTDDMVFTIKRFAKAVERHGRYYLVEERDGKVVGFISGFDDGGIFQGYMGRLVVDGNYRNQGIGESLARACLAEFKKAGVPVVYSGVKHGNESSERLLKKLGFNFGHELTWIEP